MSDARVALRVAAPILTGAALMLSLAMAVASRPVPPVVRSTVLGMVSAVGSLGALFTAPRAALHWRSICHAATCHAATVESIIVNLRVVKGRAYIRCLPSIAAACCALTAHSLGVYPPCLPPSPCIPCLVPALPVLICANPCLMPALRTFETPSSAMRW